MLPSHRSSLRLFLFFVSGLAVSASNVVLLPAQGVTDTTLVATSTFTTVGTSSAVTDAFLALTNPQGTRTYIIGRSGTVVVFDVTGGFSEVARYTLASQVSAAVLTPDGKKMLVAAGELKVIDLSVNVPTTVPSIAVGSLPNDVAVSFDSKRAYVTSAVSRSLTVVDLTINSVVHQESLTVAPRFVAVSPGGLIYVAAPSQLFEYDDQAGLVSTLTNGFTFDANPGKPQFTPSGQRVVMLNRQAGATVGLVIVDLINRTIKTALSPGVDLDQLAIASEDTGYAMGADGKIYQLTVLHPAASPLMMAGLPSSLVSFTISNESPYARYLYATTGNQTYRIDRVNANVTGPVYTASAVGSIQFNPTLSVSPVAALQPTASSVAVTPGGISYPLSVRAIDANGLPVSDATITYSAVDSSVVFQSPIARTNINGIASVRATMPTAIGKYTIRAASNSLSVNIEVSVVAQVGADSLLTIISGNGQIISTTNSGTIQSEPYKVKVVDTFGNPAPIGTTVNWQLTTGIGVSLTSTSTPTDADGIATTYVRAGGFTPISPATVTRPYSIRASVTSGAFVGSINLYGVIYPSQSEPPQVFFKNNLEVLEGEILLPAGSTLPNAFSADITVGLSSFPFIGIPNVSMRVTSLDTSTNYASCRNSPISDVAGLVSCNLVVGPNLGAATLRVMIADSSNFVYDIPIRVVPGAASKISIVQGDGQSGSSGTITPKALLVHVEDALGNPLRQASVVWSIPVGDAVLENPRSTTDNDGNASTQVKFGIAPGPVTVRATSGNVAVNFTLTNGTSILRIDSILNGASFRENVAACSVAILRGGGFTQNLSGVISATPNPTLPYTLAGASVQVGGVSVPIFYVSNIDKVEQIGIQVPCEAVVGKNTISVTALGQTATKEFTTADIAPGIFETEVTPGVKQGVVIKANGSYVSSMNPAIHGETLTGFFTGLMPPTPPVATNAVGVGQPVDIGRIIIGLKNEGMPVISAQYAPGMIGVYTIQFQVMPNAGIGDKQAYDIGVVNSQGQTIYGSNSSHLPVRAN